MRPQQNRRMRGRSNNNNNNNNRRGPNPLTRNYESSGPDVKIRGNAQHIADKYTSLSRDAQASGDRVMAENYLQHAEHYIRIILSAQPQISQPVIQDNIAEEDMDDSKTVDLTEVGNIQLPDISLHSSIGSEQTELPLTASSSDQALEIVSEETAKPARPRRPARKRLSPKTEADSADTVSLKRNHSEADSNSESVVMVKPRRGRRSTKVEKAEGNPGEAQGNASESNISSGYPI